MLLAVLWLQLPGLAGAARLSGWLVALGAALAELNAAKLQEAPVEGPAVASEAGAAVSERAAGAASAGDVTTRCSDDSGEDATDREQRLVRTVAVAISDIASAISIASVVSRQRCRRRQLRRTRRSWQPSLRRECRRLARRNDKALRVCAVLNVSYMAV